MIMQEKEKNVFNRRVATSRLINDWLFCLSEFVNESLLQYINKTWRIIQVKATIELNSIILYICFSHMVDLNKQNLQKHLKSGSKQVNATRNVCIQWFARIIVCCYLEEPEALVLIKKTIFCSPNLIKEVKIAL